MEEREIEYPGKKRIESIYEQHLFDGAFRDPYFLEGVYDSGRIGSWVIGKTLQGCRDSGEIRKDLSVFFYRGVIQILRLRESFYEVEIDIRNLLFYIQEVFRKVFGCEVLERNDIHSDRHGKNEEYVDEEFMGEFHKGIL